MSTQKSTQTKFVILLIIFQIIIITLYSLMVRYDDSADASNIDNQLVGKKVDAINSKYTMIIHIQIMLLAGFGYLMTFLKRFGYSALCFTMIITVISVELGVFLFGLTKLQDSQDGYIRISWMEVLEGGFAAATVLVSFGVLIGKTNPLQMLIMSIIETLLFVINAYIGYVVLKAYDTGGAIFIHTFGAYFGLSISATFRHRNYNDKLSSDKQNSRMTSDQFSMLGAMLLWLYWPSFNGVLTDGDGLHRSTLNTYLSLTASTLTTFVCSSILGTDRKFNMVDAQNASLSGGVILGAVSNLMLQPHGALIAGSIAGVVSTFGYQIIQGYLFDTFNIHDSCGVNNLHGMPGILAGLLSILMVGIASESDYGVSIYKTFPPLTPSNGSELIRIQSLLPSIEPGLDRSTYDQALIQLSVLVITLLFAFISGSLTGLLLNLEFISGKLYDSELFEDIMYFNLPNSPEEIETKSVEGSNASVIVTSDKDEFKIPLDNSYRPISVVPVEGVTITPISSSRRVYPSTTGSPPTSQQQQQQPQQHDIIRPGSTMYDRQDSTSPLRLRNGSLS